MKKIYILFLFFITIFINFTVLAQQTQATFSETEQRYMSQLEPFTLQKWLNRQVQENIEATYTDNFYKRSEIVSYLHKINTEMAFLDNQVIGKIVKMNSRNKNTFETTYPKLQIAGSTDVFDLIEAATAYELERQIKYYSVPLGDPQVSYVQELNRLIMTPQVPNDERLTAVENNIKKINLLKEQNPEIDFYVYLPLFLNDLSYFDITGTSAKYLQLFKEQLDDFSYTQYDSLEQALSSYYLTDHHWNHIGSKSGYEDIVKLIYGDSIKPKERINVIDFNEVRFYGYLARRIEYSIDITDTISKNVYELPKMNIYYNKEPQEQYGKLDVYMEKRFSTDRGTDHYASLYHPREPEIIFEQNNEDLDNILIFADSFSNINRDVLASHFNKTIFISPGLFKDKYGDFTTEVFEKYVADNQINKVLFMSSLISYYEIGDIKVLFEDIL